MARRRIDTPVESSASKLLQKSDGSYDLTLEIDTATGTIYEGGTAVPSGGGGSGELLKAVIPLTPAQIKNLHTTPVTLVAPAAGKYLIFNSATLKVTFGTVAYSQVSSPTLEINLGDPGVWGLAADFSNGDVISLLEAVSAGNNRFGVFVFQGPGGAGALTDQVGLGFTLGVSNGSLTVGDCPAEIHLYYISVTV